MLGLVQMPLHSYAEPNWWITYGKRAAYESVWYSSFSLVRQKRLVHQKFKLNLGLTQGVLSESDVTLVLLQSRTYSVRFSTWKDSVAPEPGLSHTLCPQRTVLRMHLSMVCPKNRILFLRIVTKGILSLNFERKYLHKTSFTCIPKCMTMTR